MPQGMGGRPPLRPAPFPWNRILLMVVLLLAAGLAMLYWRREGMRRRAKHLTPAAKVPREEDDFAPPIQPDRPITLPPRLAAKIREDTGLHRALIEEEAYYELMSQVVNRSPRFLREVLGYQRADYRALLKNPARCRGRTYYVRGVLTAVGERDLPRPVGDYRHVYFGVIKDRDGNPFWFETFAFDEERLVRLGQVAIAEGVFFKVFKYMRIPGTPYDLEGLPDQLDHLPFLLCKSVRRSYWVHKVTKLDKALVRRARWQTLADRRRLEPGPLYHLLGYMKSLASEAIPKDIPTYPDLADRLVSPRTVDRFRGEWVRFWGRLGAVYKYLDDENPAGITHHYRAYILSSSHRLVVVFLAEKPRGLKPMEDFVDVRGIYLKPWIYETESGREVQVPLVVAKTLVRKRFPPNPWFYIAGAVALLLVLGAVAVGVVVHRERREQRRFLEARIRRRRAARARSRGMTPPPDVSR